MKSYTLFFYFLLFAGLQAIAQPTLNMADVAYHVGETLTYNRTYYVNPGDSGANKTWDLSSMVTGQVSSYNTVAASSTASGSAFPNANIALGSAGGYAYYNQSSSSVQFLGISNTSFNIAYYNPEDFLRFPCNYNDSYTDTWGSNFVSGGTAFYRTGFTDVKVDGYGTLLLPGSITHNNVLRVRFHQVYQDSSLFQGIPNIIEYESETYMWYVAGVPAQVASVNRFESSGGPVQTSGLYLGNIVSSVPLVTAKNEWNVYPNPVSGDWVTVYFEAEGPFDFEARLVGMDGRQLSSATYTTTAGNNALQVALPDLSNGIYQLQLFIDNKQVGAKRLAVAR